MAKVNFKSKRSVKRIVDTVTDEVERILIEKSKFSGEVRQKYRERFKEIYSSALQQNVEIDGHDFVNCSSEEGTTEFEPVDHQKKAFINNDLMLQLETALVHTTRKRKYDPPLCKAKAIAVNNLEGKYLAAVRVKAPGVELKEELALVKTSQNIPQNMFSHTCSRATTCSKMLTGAMEQVQRLHTATSMLRGSDPTPSLAPPLTPASKLAASTRLNRKRSTPSSIPCLQGRPCGRRLRLPPHLTT